MNAAPAGPTSAAEFFEWLHGLAGDNRWELQRGRIVRETPHDAAFYLASHHVGRILQDDFHSRNQTYCVAHGIGVKVRNDRQTVWKAAAAVLETDQQFDQLEKGFAEHAPLLIVEMAEPGKSLGKILWRVGDFLQMGVRLVWVVDPLERDITVYPGRRQFYVLETSDELTGEDAMPDLRLRVADLFAMPEKKG